MFELMDTYSQNAVIKVVGVGGGGGNAVDHMVAQSIEGVDFISANTDAQALRSAAGRTVLQLGSNITKGLGAGANPELGRQAALEDRERIEEVLAGADMVKIFPAARGGPAYMTNLKMVYPEVNLIPSGGISLETAADYIKAGACAVSGARNFFNYEQVGQFGVSWVTEQVAKYIEIVAQAKATAPPLP